MINYSDKHHVYFNDDNVIYDSPTKILKKYKQRFDAKTAAKHYAKRHGETPAYWQSEWKRKSQNALSRGHKIHAEREELAFGRGVERVAGQVKPVINGQLYNTINLYDLPDGIYPELPIWNDGWMVAGRPDKFVIETIDGERYIDMYDYKSNAEIKKIGWKDWSGEYKRMLDPISHLMDSTWTHYALQLSMYHYILETHGFIPRKTQVIHIPHPYDVLGIQIQPPDVIYKLPYLKKEVLMMLEHYNRKRKKVKYEPIPKTT